MEQLASTLHSNRGKWLMDIEKRKADRERAKADRAARTAREEALAGEMNIPGNIRKMSELEEGAL